MTAGPRGWVFRDRFAGILWARNNCLGLAAQLPAAQISDPRGLDTPSMGTCPGPLPPGSAPSCRRTVASPSRWGPPGGFSSPWLGSKDRGWPGEVQNRVHLCHPMAEKRLKGRVTRCLFSLQHCPFVPRVPCQGRTLPESSVSAALSSFTECPPRIKLFWEEPIPGTTFLSAWPPKPHLSQVPTICSAHRLLSVLRVKRLYLSLSGWRGWVVQEGRCSFPPLLTRGRSLSGWTLAPQSTWLSPFSSLHSASDTTISTFM